MIASISTGERGMVVKVEPRESSAIFLVSQNRPGFKTKLRSLAADMLVGDTHLGILPLASKDNPADEPSREKRVRRADPGAAPEWARRLVAGDVFAIDTVLPADPRLQWCCSPQVGNGF